ncbi:hypothetical protein DW757_07440 [Clostridium sp. AM29-11AC]|nr:hypothetical protein DW757_07440 [Clostridium sp. AM29-11AC]
MFESRDGIQDGQGWSPSPVTFGTEREPVRRIALTGESCPVPSAWQCAGKSARFLNEGGAGRRGAYVKTEFKIPGDSLRCKENSGVCSVRQKIKQGRAGQLAPCQLVLLWRNIK